MGHLELHPMIRPQLSSYPLSSIVIANASFNSMKIQSIIDELILQRILPQDYNPETLLIEIWQAFEDDFEWDDIDTVEVDGERFYIQKIE